MWCAKWRNKLNPEKTKVIILSRSVLIRKTELNLKLYGETLKIYPQVKFLDITFDSQLTFKKNTLRTSWTAEIPGTSFKAVRQQEVGTKPSHTTQNLQTTCLTNF